MHGHGHASACHVSRVVLMPFVEGHLETLIEQPIPT
jgi:hypothetical protein